MATYLWRCPTCDERREARSDGGIYTVFCPKCMTAMQRDYRAEMAVPHFHPSATKKGEHHEQP